MGQVTCQGEDVSPTYYTFVNSHISIRNVKALGGFPEVID
jgi:hypothetical protein